MSMMICSMSCTLRVIRDSPVWEAFDFLGALGCWAMVGLVVLAGLGLPWGCLEEAGSAGNMELESAGGTATAGAATAGAVLAFITWIWSKRALQWRDQA